MEKILRDLTFGKALLIGAGILAAYYFGMYNDGSSIQTNINVAQVEVQKNRAELATIKKAEEDAARYEATMKVLGDDMNKVVKAIPAELSSFEMLKTVSVEAKTAGLEIIKLNAGQTFRNNNVNKDGPALFYEPVEVEVEVSGAYPQIMLFFSNLTKLDKIVTSNQLNLSLKSVGPSLKGHPSLMISCGARLTAYRYVPPQDSGKKGGAN